MRLIETPIPGCFEISCAPSADRRGRFVKTYHSEFFRDHGLRQDWQEEYYSVSALNVVRGMHFQTPPMDHAKLVYCLSGAVLDVVLDLRTGSPTHGQVATFELSADQANSLYLPAGVAHGFLSRADDTIMQYKVTSVYAAAHDGGVLWNSIGFEWPVDSPILSERDAGHPPLAAFRSPF